MYAPSAHSREFFNSVLHLNFGMMFAFPFGEMIDYERDNFSITSGGNTFKADHYDQAFGLTADITPFDPFLLGNDMHAFKFGIRTGYKLNYFQQTITVEEGTNKSTDYGGYLMTYQNWFVGPVVHYSPFVESMDIESGYSSGVGFTFFILYGQLVNGKYSAYPAMRSYTGSAPSPYQSNLKGYKIDAGFGAEIAACSLNVGINIYYSYIVMSLDKQIYPSISKNSSIQEVCFEVYVGIPIQWIKFPKIF